MTRTTWFSSGAADGGGGERAVAPPKYPKVLIVLIIITRKHSRDPRINDLLILNVIPGYLRLAKIVLSKQFDRCALATTSTAPPKRRS